MNHARSNNIPSFGVRHTVLQKSDKSRSSPNIANASCRKTHYNNTKLKTRVGWTPKERTAEGLSHHCEASRTGGRDAEGRDCGMWKDGGFARVSDPADQGFPSRRGV